MRRLTFTSAIVASMLIGTAGVGANPLEPGWSLDPGMSNLRFQSIKNTTKVESSSFATYSGSIEPNGSAEISVALDSVDTKVDIRNVRMRFLFFETFNFPEATIRTQIPNDKLEQLASQRRMNIQLPFSLDLHGVKKTFVTEVVATLLTDDLVSVASATPISIAVAEFGLTENLGKLQEAAGGVVIVPSATVSFDFLFRRNGPVADAPAVAEVAPQPAEKQTPEVTTAQATTTVAPTNVALETQGDFGLEECVGRFETISAAGKIFFRSGSATIDTKSEGVLRTLADVVTRCPDLTIEVGGHTDSDGSDGANQRLSERRAGAVAGFLIDQGIEKRRLVAVGYGEANPVVPNDSSANKRRNRRIEFLVLN